MTHAARAQHQSYTSKIMNMNVYKLCNYIRIIKSFHAARHTHRFNATLPAGVANAPRTQYFWLRVPQSAAAAAPALVGGRQLQSSALPMGLLTSIGSVSRRVTETGQRTAPADRLLLKSPVLPLPPVPMTYSGHHQHRGRLRRPASAYCSRSVAQALFGATLPLRAERGP